MRDYKFSLVAGVAQTHTIGGNAYHVMLASSEIIIQLDDGIERKRYQSTGEYAIPDEFKTVTIKSVTTQDVTIAIGKGRISDARATLTGGLTTTPDVPNVITPKASVSVASGATVLLAGADATRKALRLGIKSSEAGGVYLGNISVAVALQGGYLELGGADYIDGTMAIYAYNPNASAVVVNVLSIEKV